MKFLICFDILDPLASFIFHADRNILYFSRLASFILSNISGDCEANLTPYLLHISFLSFLPKLLTLKHYLHHTSICLPFAFFLWTQEPLLYIQSISFEICLFHLLYFSDWGYSTPYLSKLKSSSFSDFLL